MNAPFDQLRADLVDLAEDVTIVDLRDRTLRTSRKLGIRRTLVAAAAATAVLAVGAGTAFATLPHRHTALPAGTGQPDEPSGTASATPTASPSGSPPAAATELPGMYLYRLDTADGTTTNDLLHRAPGGDWQKIASVKQPAVPPPNGPPAVAMSPDHQHIAWLLDGKLRVSAIDGSQVKTVVANVQSAACTAVAWTADSRRLLFSAPATGDPKASTIQSVNIDGTGRQTIGTISGMACDTVSVDGRTAYGLTSSGGRSHLVVYESGAGPRIVTANWPAGREPFEVIAAEVGSTRLLVSTVRVSDGCGCSPPQRYAIVDTATGQVTSLDNANDAQGSAPVSGAFTADGRVVLIADRNRGNGSGVVPFLTVFSPGGAILTSVPLPDMEVGFLAGFDE